MLLALLAPLPAAFAAPPAWRWDPAPHLYPLAPLVAAEGAVVLRPPETDGAPLRLQLGERAVAVPFGATWEDLDGADLAVDADQVYIVHHNAIATGAELVALDRETGAEAWRVHLTGVGSIGHSKYRNQARLQLLAGVPTVFGWESGGRYVEQRDPATGALLDHTKLDSVVNEPDVAAALFRELVQVRLASSAVVTVDPADFLVRHGLAPGGVRREAAAARLAPVVAALDGQPLLQPGRVLHARLEADGRIQAFTGAQTP